MNGNHNFIHNDYFNNGYYGFVPSNKLKSIYAFPPQVWPAEAKSLTYEPTLKIDLLTDYDKRLYDNSDPIWGFKNIRGKILDDPTNENYSRLIIESSDSSIINNIANPILSENWVADELGRHKDLYTIPLSERTYYDSISSGYYYYLTINLRRLNENDTLLNSNPVLKIKLLGKGLDEDSLITEKYIFYSTIIDKDSIKNINFGDDRGYEFKLDTVSSNNLYNEIIITNDMIPFEGEIRDGKEMNKDITLSYLIKFDGPTNKILKKINDYDKSTSEFDKLKIEVYYMGTPYTGLDIAIDWIRIEDVIMYNLHRGKYDTQYSISNNHNSTENLKTYMQNKGLNKTDTLNSYNVFRFYSNASNDDFLCLELGF